MTLTFHIGVGIRRKVALDGADLGQATPLAAALQAAGHHTTLFYRGETPDLSQGQGDRLGVARDVVLRIVGPHLEEPVPGLTNLLWVTSAPAVAPLGMLRRFQTVFFASDALATHYAGLGLRAQTLWPFARDLDAAEGQGGDADGSPLDLAVIGDGGMPHLSAAIAAAEPLGLSVRVWGRGWQDRIPEALYGGPHLTPEALRQVFGRARAVIQGPQGWARGYGFAPMACLDAMACGAVAITQQVSSAEAEALPYLCPLAPGGMEETLRRALALGSHAPKARRSIAASATAWSDPAPRIAALEAACAAPELALPAFRGLGTAVPPGDGPLSEICDLPDDESLPCDPETRNPAFARLDTLRAQLAAGPVQLRLGDASVTPEGLPPEAAMRRAAEAVLRIGLVFEHAPPEVPQVAPPPAAGTGVIHPMMFAHRRAQQIACGPWGADAGAELAALCAQARRLLELHPEPTHPFGWLPPARGAVPHLVRAMTGRPGYAHTPEGYSRAEEKRHLSLWPRAKPAAPARPIGVLLHLFYPDLAPLFAKRLQVLTAPHRLYVSTDTQDKADQISAHLPQAEIRVLPNRGRDVFPKLFGFADVYDQHDLMLHLHGKKSLHAQALDDWLALILDCLLPPEPQMNRLLSFFANVPALGIVAPLTYKAVIGAAHWGDNLDMAEELMARMGRDMPASETGALGFPVGGMFWARSAVLRPLVDLGLTEAHFPPEAGQVDGTVAHAFERLYGVICRQEGYHFLRVAPQGSTLYRAYQMRYRSNGALRDALAEGVFDG